MRLQPSFSREIPPNEAAVRTIGSVQAGKKENVIPVEAIIKLYVTAALASSTEDRACGQPAAGS
jgi:metal-dependent amidase/aminoacylase/carboxypeptidase family protein